MELGKRNQARARAEKSALARLLAERSRSNASGIHGNKSEKRIRTRSAKRNRLIKESLDND